MTTHDAWQIVSRNLDESRQHTDDCLVEQSSGCGDPAKADVECNCYLAELDEAFGLITDKLRELGRVRAELDQPIGMLLFCPNCGLQHIDAPDELTPDWTNPPHKSHLCHGCKHIWRPCDRPTNGVEAITTSGSNDGCAVSKQSQLHAELGKATAEYYMKAQAYGVEIADLRALLNRVGPVLDWIHNQGEVGKSVVAQIKPLVDGALTAPIPQENK